MNKQLTTKQWALGGASLAVIMASAVPAFAVTPTGWLYAGGATFPEKVYRDIMNCYSNHSGTDTETGLTAHTCSTGDVGFTAPYKPAVQNLYAGVGSGNGKIAFWNHDANHLTDGSRQTTGPDTVPVPSTADAHPYYVNGAAVDVWGSNWAAARGTNHPFPTMSFIGSDDPLLPSDLVDPGKYNANSATNGWGPAIQVPALVGAVGLMYNPASGGNITWTENGVAPTNPIGTPSGVSLSTNTWCGIMTGAITDWNNAEITADNQGTSITGNVSAPITVVVRSDGSGTTFIMANGLINQCALSTHPVPMSWQTAIAGAKHNDAGLSNNDWFINVINANLTTNFIGQNGSGGITTYVIGHPGTVGYASTDFEAPVNQAPGAPKAMNLQTWNTFKNNLAPEFKQPNYNSSAAIMVGAKIPSSKAASCVKNAVTYAPGTSKDGICSHNPVNWGVTNPTPTGPAAYPIGGFTFQDYYSCYATVANGGVTTAPRLIVNTGKVGWLRWYFGITTVNSSKVLNSLHKNGFAPIPAAWRTAVYTLLFTDAKTKIAAPGTASSPCSGITAVPGHGA